MVILAAAAMAEEAGVLAESRTNIAGEFGRLDDNDDQQLRLDEFLRRDGNEQVLRRDFQLYDFDGSGSLSRTEFASVSGLAPPSLRGAMPDPYDDLVADAVAALDQSYDHWNRRPNELVNAHTFVANFIGSISQGGKRYVTGRILRHADLDGDGRLSRPEAKQFLQYQLGVRWQDGPLLRESTGRLVRLDRFLAVDRDRNGQLSYGEFETHWPERSSVEADFRGNDRDGNGSITYVEYAHYQSQNFFDPIEWFRDADANLDAFVDQQELLKASDPVRARLASSTMSGFDDDEDGKLSLREYRLSMHANVNYSWDAVPVDLNRDGRLNYNEFVFNEIDLFQLQRRYFFHRLDRDGDGSLSTSEFDFQSRTSFSIHRRSFDGSKSRQLYRNDRYPRCGWPCVSPDGRLILFHRDATDGQEESARRIVVMNEDGENVRELCDGSNPSWSADGKRFVCERKTSDVIDVWIMEADGRSGVKIARGRSPKWSPDGSSIAYLHENGIWTYDVESGASRPIMGRADHACRSLGDDVAWSPDGKSLAVLATKEDSSEMMIVDVEGAGIPISKPEWKFPLTRGVNLNWKTRYGIVFAVPIGVASEESKEIQRKLISILPGRNEKPRPLPNFSNGARWRSACVAPDGNSFILVSE